jgi:hypothetical protein
MGSLEGIEEGRLLLQIECHIAPLLLVLKAYLQHFFEEIKRSFSIFAH